MILLRHPLKADAATEAVVEQAATEETAAAPEETAEDSAENPAS